MNWLFYAILSPAVYTIVNFVDKYILSKHIKDYRGMSMFAAIMATIFGTLFWVINGRPSMATHDIFLIIASGILTFSAQVLYFKALSFEETSKIMILFAIAPVITLVLSFLFLGEQIGLRQLLGFVIIFVSVIGVSIQGQKINIKLSPALYLIILNSLLWSTGAVLFKLVIDQNSFTQVVAYESWGIGIGGMVAFLLFKGIRSSFLETLKSVRKSVVFFIFLNEGIFVVSRLLAFLAISMGPLALVSIIGNTNVFFGLIYGTILTLIWPMAFEEDISRRGLIKKAGFSLLAFLGIVLIN
jgi:drug/metabolite transporter (DMT)-like permease